MDTKKIFIVSAESDQGSVAAIVAEVERSGAAALTVGSILPGAQRKAALKSMVGAADLVLCLVSEDFLSNEGEHWRVTRMALARMEMMKPGSIFVVPFWTGSEPRDYGASTLGHLRGGQLHINRLLASTHG
jgi:hypothetical protein